MRRALLASASVLALLSAAPAHAQLNHISRGVDDLVELLTGIFDSVTKGLEESPVPDPGSYITRLAAELELAPWYTQAGWDTFVADTYPTQYLDTWQQRAEWQVRHAAATAEHMAREALISAGISGQQPFTAARLDLIGVLNKTPLGVLFAQQLAVENGLINGQLLSELSSHATMAHQRDTEDRLERVYRGLQGAQLHAARNGGVVPDTAAPQWSTVVVGESVQHAAPPLVEIPVTPPAPGT